MKSDAKKEQDKKGKERMGRFEQSQLKKEDDSDYDETTIIAYQNINDNGWEKVEVPFKRKKR